MNIGDISAKLGLDLSLFKRGIRDAKLDVSGLKDGLNRAFTPTGITRYADSLSGLKLQLKTLRNEYSTLVNEEASAEERAAALNRQIELQSQVVQKLNEKWRTAVETSGEMSQASLRLQTRLSSEQKTLSAMQSQRSTVITPAAKGGSEKSGGIFSNEGSMNLMYAGMTTAAFAAPVVLGFKAAISQAAQFDQAMRNVNTMMQLPENQFQAMKQKVVDLTRQLPYSAQGMAQALYQVYSANVPLNQSLGFTKIAAKSAAAGMGTTQDAVLALTETIKSYGMSFSQAQHVSDLMFQTIKDGQTTFPELSQNIGMVASEAHDAGVTLPELMAGYATLTGVTGNTSEVTTQLVNIFKEVIHPAKSVAKEAAALGLNFNAAALQSEGFAGFLQKVEKATHGNSAELAKLFPNVRGLKGMMALTTTQLDTYNKKLADMKNASNGAGQTSAAFSQAMKGQADQFQIFKNNIAALGMTISKTLMPAINAIIPRIENLLKWFGQHQKLTKFLIETLAIGGGFAAILTPMFMLLSGIGQVKMGLESLGIIGRVAKGIEGAGSELGIFGRIAKTVFTGMFGPWGILVAAIITGVVLLITHWKQVNQWLQTHFGFTIPQILHQLLSVFKVVWNGIKSAVVSVWNYIGPTIISGVQAVARFWKQIWPELKQVFKDVWDAMKIILAPFLANLYIMISVSLSVIRATWKNVWNMIVDVLKIAWDVISGVIKIAWHLISGDIKVGLDILTGHWGRAWTDFKNIFKNVWNDIKGMFGSLLHDALDFGKNFIMMIIHGIEGAASGLWNAVKGVAGHLTHWLGFHSPSKGLPDSDQWAPNFIKMFTTGLEDGVPKIDSIFAQLRNPGELNGIGTQNATSLGQETAHEVTSQTGQIVMHNTFHVHNATNFNDSRQVDELSQRFAIKVQQKLASVGANS